jgi:tetratricopeptide (TPR) repeat protein
MIKKIRIVFFLLFFPFLQYAGHREQDIRQLIKEAREAEIAHNETLALQKYLEVVHRSPSLLEALCKTSELYCTLGRRQTTESARKEYYYKGLDWAKKAYTINPEHAESNFVMSFAMGRLALIASGEEKIDAVRDIKKYAERTIKFDPNNFKGYHVLGKWHYEVSNLSSLERWLVRIAFGALPPSSFSASVSNYEKSKKLNPAFLLNYLELAKAYDAIGQRSAAIKLLHTISGIPDSTSDDGIIRAEAKALLSEWTKE